jgi:hypothetical protein
MPIVNKFFSYFSGAIGRGKGQQKNGLKEVKMACAKKCFVLGRRSRCNLERREWHRKSPKGKLDFHKCGKAQHILTRSIPRFCLLDLFLSTV